MKTELPLSLEILVNPKWELKSVLAVRSVLEEENDVTQVLIKWEWQSEDDATWMELVRF